MCVCDLRVERASFITHLSGVEKQNGRRERYPPKRDAMELLATSHTRGGQQLGIPETVYFTQPRGPGLRVSFVLASSGVCLRLRLLLFLILWWRWSPSRAAGRAYFRDACTSGSPPCTFALLRTPLRKPALSVRHATELCRAAAQEEKTRPGQMRRRVRFPITSPPRRSSFSNDYTR